MDEVIACVCGSQAWVIGMNGVRCSECKIALPNTLISGSVQQANQYLRKLPKAAEAKQVQGTTR